MWSWPLALGPLVGFPIRVARVRNTWESKNYEKENMRWMDKHYWDSNTPFKRPYSKSQCRVKCPMTKTVRAYGVRAPRLGPLGFFNNQEQGTNTIGIQTLI